MAAFLEPREIDRIALTRRVLQDMIALSNATVSFRRVRAGSQKAGSGRFHVLTLCHIDESSNSTFGIFLPRRQKIH